MIYGSYFLKKSFTIILNSAIYFYDNFQHFLSNSKLSAFPERLESAGVLFVRIRTKEADRKKQKKKQKKTKLIRLRTTGRAGKEEGEDGTEGAERAENQQ